MAKKLNFVNDQLSFFQKFPDLKFKYVEEDQPEDFFVPYVWALAMRKTYWNEANVKLLS